MGTAFTIGHWLYLILYFYIFSGVVTATPVQLVGKPIDVRDIRIEGYTVTTQEEAEMEHMVSFKWIRGGGGGLLLYTYRKNSDKKCEVSLTLCLPKNKLFYYELTQLNVYSKLLKSWKTGKKVKMTRPIFSGLSGLKEK